MEHRGGCLCGAVQYCSSSQPVEAGYCHCRMCQSLSGAAVQPFASFRAGDFSYVRGQPAIFPSSEHGQREFCPTCGSQIAFRGAGEAETVEINIGTLQNPERISPQYHIWVDSRIPWFDTADDLPRFPRAKPSARRAVVTVRLRNEQASDAAAIRRLIAAAFREAPDSSQTEHYIVGALRDAGQLAVSLVAEDEEIVGHVAVSPVTISDGSSGWFGLGPVSVRPSRQGQGIGSRLVERALSELRGQNAAGCVVVGEPGYYGRFGFRKQRNLVLPDVPAEYFQAIVLRGAVPAGIVSYHKAFSASGDR